MLLKAASYNHWHEISLDDNILKAITSYSITCTIVIDWNGDVHWVGCPVWFLILETQVNGIG